MTRLRAAALRAVSLGAAALSLAACATEPVCREPGAAERALFTAIVAHDEDALAAALSPSAGALKRRLGDLENNPQLARQIFGLRMGEPSVRTVLMQPPVCVYDADDGRGDRLSFVMPRARFAALQDPRTDGAEVGQPGLDHAACRFEQVGEAWRLSDACLTTFRRSRPAG